MFDSVGDSQIMCVQDECDGGAAVSLLAGCARVNASQILVDAMLRMSPGTVTPSWESGAAPT
jgi:hypothetical protein